MSYIEDTAIDRQLVLDFFLCFSRFEFALKVSGYARGDASQVSPDWDRFAAEIHDTFEKDRTQALAQACESYLLNPPKKQVLANGSLAWSTDLPVDSTRQPELLISLVRRVRNNLFHGGKYSGALHEETARNEELLRGGLTILDECLRINPHLRAAFEGAAI